MVSSTTRRGAISGVVAVSVSTYFGTTSVCALSRGGGVDCWGNGIEGDLGNGNDYLSGEATGSTVPVAVRSTTGAGSLAHVASLTANSSGTCAVLTTGSVDCWGQCFDAARPTPVVSTTGTGSLAGVGQLSELGGGDCAVLSTHGVDCLGSDGWLGTGTYPSSGLTPVQVVAPGGTGVLSDV